MKTVFAVIFLLAVLIFTSLSQADFIYAVTCSSVGGFCYGGMACSAEGGIIKTGVTGCSASVCCAFPTATPTPNAAYCKARGGFCFAHNSCLAEGGHQSGDDCPGTNICCVVPTNTPTPTPTTPPTCNSLFGQCFPNPPNLCQAENGTVRSATGCGGSTPICCVYNDPTTRCNAIGGQVILTNYLEHVNDSDLLFPIDSVSNCYRPKVAGCNLGYGGTSTTAGCGCIDTFTPTRNWSGCSSGLYCRSGFVSGSTFIPQSVATTDIIPNAGDWFVDTNQSDEPVRVYSNPYTSNHAYLGSTKVDQSFSSLYRFDGVCSTLPVAGGSGGGGATTPPPVYSISGGVFNDLNKNYVKDAGEGKDWTAAVNFDISPANGTVTVNANGTYTITGLPAGIYTVTLSSGIPESEGYANYYPLTGPPPKFLVTVGPGCTYLPTNPNAAGGGGATCDGAGNISNLNFVLTNSVPWFQTYGLDVRIDSGLNNLIPASPLFPAFMSVIDNLN